MFGYIKPYKNELKMKHINEYKTCYCILCNGIRKYFGFFYTVFLNYESVFLLILLEGICKHTKNEIIKMHCFLNPLKKGTKEVDHNLLKYVSFINIYLVVLKLEDDYIDKRNFFALLIKYGIKCSAKYKKSLIEYEEVVNRVAVCVDELNRLEKSEMISFDECAETMGRLLEIIIEFYLEHFHIVAEKDILLKIGNILGKWLYLADAYDDYENDISKNKFNPLKEFVSDDEESSDVNNKAIIMFSFMIMELKYMYRKLNIYKHKEIIENIIEWGMNDTILKITYEKKGKLQNV